MASAARLDERWDDAFVGKPTRTHLEANRWVDPVVTTKPVRCPRRERDGLEFHGVTINWDRPLGDDFPQPVLDGLFRLEGFMALPVNWDSYGGRPMESAAVRHAVN